MGLAFYDFAKFDAYFKSLFYIDLGITNYLSLLWEYWIGEPCKFWLFTFIPLVLTGLSGKQKRNKSSAIFASQRWLLIIQFKRRDVSQIIREAECGRPEAFSSFESLRTKPVIPLIPEKTGPDNLHVERKKFAPREDESFLWGSFFSTRESWR